MWDKVLVELGLKYEDLTSAERDTLNSWMQALQSNQMTIESVKGYITSMRDAVEQELEKSDNPKELDILLKARLKNYRLLDAFLTSPEKAKTAIERSLASFAVRKGSGTT